MKWWEKNSSNIFLKTLVWARVDSEGDRCYATAHHQGRRYVWIHIHSIFSWSKVQKPGCGKGSVCQPALLSSFGTLGGDYLGANLIPWLLQHRTPFGVTVWLMWWHSTWFVLTSKQYLHIHHIINMIKLLQCFHININMLPVDQKAHDVTDRTNKSVTWSLTGRPLLALILSTGICGVYTFNMCNRNMCFCC